MAPLSHLRTPNAREQRLASQLEQECLQRLPRLCGAREAGARFVRFSAAPFVHFA